MLDIGCNGGFYSLEMKRRGADRVVGIDFDDYYLDQARFAADVLDLDVEFRKLSVYDVGAVGERFDVVIFMGLLYHLRHPLLALDLIREHVAGDLLVYQSLQRGSPEVEPWPTTTTSSTPTMFDRPGYPKLHFIEKRYSHDETNWWAPNAACSAAMLRSAGFEVVAHPEEEIFVARRAEMPFAPDGRRAVYPARPATDHARNSTRASPGRWSVVEAAMLWNEPNNKSHWDPELDPEWRTFGALVTAAGRAIRAESATLPRVLGGMSPIDPKFVNCSPPTGRWTTSTPSPSTGSRSTGTTGRSTSGRTS